MARLSTFGIEGDLSSCSYSRVSSAVSYLLEQKKTFAQALERGDTIYSWDMPPELVVVKINSDGGDVSGLYTAAASLKELNKEIPVITIVTGSCCSAAYMLVVGSSKIIALPATQLGSLAVASGFSDNREALKKEGILSYFYATHKKKQTGFSGQEYTPAEIETLLKTSSDQYFEILNKFMESCRAGISNEIKALDGASFIVNGEEETLLYDLTASSLEEVLKTLGETDMQTLSQMFNIGNGGSSNPATTNAQSQKQAPAVVLTPEQTAQAQEIARVASGFFQQNLAQAGFVEGLATALKASKAFSGEAAAQAPALEDIKSTKTEASALATAEELFTIGQGLKATAEQITLVGSWGLNKEQASKAMQGLVAAADRSTVNEQQGSPFSNKDAMAGDDQKDGVMAKLSAMLFPQKTQ
jgi:hypothetical protein